MKIRKRVLSLLVSISLMMPAAAYAAGICGTEITTAPADWTLNSATVQNGDLNMEFNTLAAASRGKSEITTSAYSFANSAFYLSFDSTASVQNDGTAVEQSLSMADDNAFNTNKLFYIKDGSISVFGDAASSACTEDTAHRITLAVDPTGETVKAIAWVDGSIVYNGEYSAWKTAIDMSGTKLVFRNNATSSISDKASWKVQNFVMNKLSGTYQLGSMPANGQEMISPSGIDGVTVRFGTRMADSVYAKANYTLSDENGAVDFTVKQSGNDIKLVPSDGFSDRTAYTVTVASIVDIWGVPRAAEAQTITFTTAYEGYVPPTVDVEGETARSIYQGESEEITFTADQAVVRMEILKDGTKVAELYGAPYTYTLTDTQPGTVSITAVAYDAEGGSAISEEVKVQTLAHAAPTVTVSGITDQASYAVAELPTVTVTANDDNGVAKIAAYADDTLLDQVSDSTMRLNLRGIAAGSHTLTFMATDIYGMVGSVQYQITVTSGAFSTSYTNDFETYTGNNTAPSNMEGTSQRGYLDVGTIDEDHGKSLLIGIDEANVEFNENNTAYVGIPQGGGMNKVQTNFDLYVSAKPAGQYRMSFKQTGGAETTFLFINNNYIRLCNKSWTVSRDIAYDAGVWYSVNIVADTAQKTYTITITDPNGTVHTENGVLDAGLNSLDRLRVFGPADDSVKSFVAIDNVVVKKVMDFPTLSASGTVAPAKNSVTITSSQALKMSDYTLENIKLYDAYGAVALQSAEGSDDQTFVLKTVSPLRSNMQYKVVLSGDVRFSAGGAMGAPVEGYFTTASAVLDVVSGTFESGKFRYTAQNRTESKQTVTVIVQKWTADGAVADTAVTEQEIAIGSAGYEVSVPSCGGGESITVYFWDSLVSPSPISTKIWSNR